MERNRKCLTCETSYSGKHVCSAIPKLRRCEAPNPLRPGSPLKFKIKTIFKAREVFQSTKHRAHIWSVDKTHPGRVRFVCLKGYRCTDCQQQFDAKEAVLKHHNQGECPLLSPNERRQQRKLLLSGTRFRSRGRRRNKREVKASKGEIRAKRSEIKAKIASFKNFLLPEDFELAEGRPPDVFWCKKARSPLDPRMKDLYSAYVTQSEQPQEQHHGESLKQKSIHNKMYTRPSTTQTEKQRNGIVSIDMPLLESDSEPVAEVNSTSSSSGCSNWEEFGF